MADRQTLLNLAVTRIHYAADKACGRPWVCACGICRQVRRRLTSESIDLFHCDFCRSRSGVLCRSKPSGVFYDIEFAHKSRVNRIVDAKLGAM